jgi:hypothetical protein
MGAFLTDQQIADYDRDGFLVLPNFATPGACQALKAQAVCSQQMNSRDTPINSSLTQPQESFVFLKKKPLMKWAT